MLLTLFQELNTAHFGGELPPPKLIWNKRLSSSAGRFRPGSRSPIFPREPEIEIATYLREIPEGSFHIRDTMLHEMVHYYLWHHRRPYGHTPEFHEILKRVGARRYNTVPKFRAAKRWYQCPTCRVVIPTRRRIRDSACASCCKKWNGGRFAEKFRLQEIADPGNAPLRAPKPEEAIVTLSPEEVIQKLEALKGMLLRSRT
jgi:predicted SprT family Zn-dependent metalloprotease